MNERPNIERIKARLAADVVRIIAEHKLSDAEARVRLGVSDAELARLRNGELDTVSTDRLLALLDEFGQRVELSVTAVPSPSNARRPIWEEIDEIVAGIPPEEFERLPTDLAANVDHYLYGAPKRD